MKYHKNSKFKFAKVQILFKVLACWLALGLPSKKFLVRAEQTLAEPITNRAKPNHGSIHPYDSLVTPQTLGPFQIRVLQFNEFARNGSD